jgi:hypothetical protein
LSSKMISSSSIKTDKSDKSVLLSTLSLQSAFSSESSLPGLQKEEKSHEFHSQKIDSNNQDLDFNLDSSLIDTNIVKRIGIEKSSNSIIVEACNQIIIQTIFMDDFSDKTIKPLKKQLDKILSTFKKGVDVENQKIINSIITCINRNIIKISKHKDEKAGSQSDSINEKESKKINKLIDLALNPENTEQFFKDQYGGDYAATRLGSDWHLEILSLNSNKYKRYLSRLYRENTEFCIGDSSLNSVITNLASEAEFNGIIIPLHLRVAWGSVENHANKECIYYDMCDTQGRIIVISRDGWRIINGNEKDIPIIFKRHNQQPQIEPDKNYSADIFEKLLNLTNVKNPTHRHLLKVYIMSTLIPEIDHVILTTYGPKGSAKSFLLELIKKMIDPTKPVLLTLNKNMEEFIQQVNHNYLCYYDNVKFIPYWLSDEICRAVTGAGHTKRKKYTDDDDIIYEHRRCLGVNGINIALTESDALDRCILIELEDIDEEKRRKESDLWKEFERLKPQALAYILDIIVKAIQIKPTLNLKRLSRMADFTEWAEAISQAMGYPPMSFIDIYADNRNEQNIIAINENLVGSILLKYILDIETEQGRVTKTTFQPEDLYNILTEYVENNNINIDIRQFPKNASSLVKKIKTVIPNLKTAYGIYIEIGRNKKDNTSIITLYKKTKDILEDNNDIANIPLNQHLYVMQILRKTLSINNNYDQIKSEKDFAKIIPSESCISNMNTGASEPPEAISSKLVVENFNNFVISKSNNIEDSTKNFDNYSGAI